MRKCRNICTFLPPIYYVFFVALDLSVKRYSNGYRSSDFNCRREKRLVSVKKKNACYRTGGSYNFTSEPCIPALDYETLNPCTGKSVVQERFDALAFSALLRNGPAPPVQIYEKFCSSPRCKLVLACDINKEWQLKSSDVQHEGSIVFQDEMQLKVPEVLHCLRKEKPSFSVKNDCGGVPFSLLIKNCLYFQAFRGYVCYMRVVRILKGNVSSEIDGMKYRGKPFLVSCISQSAEEEDQTRQGDLNTPKDRNRSAAKRDYRQPQDPHRSEVYCDFSYFVFSLDQYKYNEPTSQDGIRCGPQPWLYSAS